MAYARLKGGASFHGMVWGMLVLACQIAAVRGHAQFASGAIYGKVSDPGGKPIRIEVRLLEINGLVVRSTYSDETNGQFSFTDLRATAYHIVVDAEPYRHVDTEVLIRPIFQPTVHVNVFLEFKSGTAATAQPGITGSESRTVRLKELQARHPKKLVKVFEKAERARARGDFDKAAQYYQEILRQDPVFGPALTNLGGIFLRRGQFAEAEQAFDKAFRLDPDSAEASINLGHLYLETGRLGEAERFLVRSTERAPQSALAHFLLGSTLARRGTVPEAEKSLNRAIALDEQNVTPARLVLANLYLKAHRWQEASATLQSYLSAHPQDPQADNIRQTLRQIQTQQGQPQ